MVITHCIYSLFMIYCKFGVVHTTIVILLVVTSNGLCPNDDYGDNYVEVIVGLGVPPPSTNYANNIQTAINIAENGDTILIHPPFTQETVRKYYLSCRSVLSILLVSYVYIYLYPFSNRHTLIRSVQNPDLTLPFGGCRLNCTAYAEGGFDGQPWSPATNFTNFLIDQRVNVSKSVTITSKCIMEGDDRVVLTTLSPLTPSAGAGCTPSLSRCKCEIMTIESSCVTVTQINILGCDPLDPGFIPAPGIYVGIRNLTDSTINATTPSGSEQVVGHIDNVTISNVYFNGTLPAIIVGPVSATQNTSALSNFTVTDNVFVRTGSALSLERVFCIGVNQTDVDSMTTCSFTLNNISELGNIPSNPALGDLYSQSLGLYIDWQSNIYAPLFEDPSVDNIVSGVCIISCFILNASLYDLPQFRNAITEVVPSPVPVSGSILFALFLLLGVVLFIALLFFFLWYADRRSREEQMRRERKMDAKMVRRTLENGSMGTVLITDRTNIPRRRVTRSTWIK